TGNRERAMQTSWVGKSASHPSKPLKSRQLPKRRLERDDFSVESSGSNFLLKHDAPCARGMLASARAEPPPKGIAPVMIEQAATTRVLLQEILVIRTFGICTRTCGLCTRTDNCPLWGT